ncbi:MAG: hypothetical protein AABZ79_25350 [Pseudomonadota bacterium]|jgi:hypothetical protein|uniref:Uncharacterized protein n=1 Tax=Cupriavidus metallidurans TaxID=119219 RepID=A0A482IXK8_9BURK|nr:MULTISPECIES: hypothetical protein [Cupriavidus]QBP12293.1 hypothetical protein DDF84_021315 [Cupriavidus metallidurans]
MMNAPMVPGPLVFCVVRRDALVTTYRVSLPDGRTLIEGAPRGLDEAEDMLACAGALYVIESGKRPDACDIAMQITGLDEVYGSEDQGNIGRILLTAFADGIAGAVLED